MVNGWIECNLGEIITYQNGRSMEHLFSQYGKYKVISIGNYSLDSRYIDNKVRIDEKNFSEFMKFIPHKNDLTMILNDKTSTGEIIGRVLLIDESDRYVINQRTLRITLFKNASPLFFYYLLNSNIVRKSILDSAKPGTQIYINTPDVLGIHIHFPVNVKEQIAIATVLSDTDAFIAGMEKLIAKKRAIRQGTMQELLTGKKRLVGFNGEWVEKKLKDVALDIKTGKRNNEDKIENGKYPLFVRSHQIQRINEYSYNCEAILVPGEGNIGQIFHYINGKFDCHQRVYKISEFAGVDAKFIFFYMKMFFGQYALMNTVKATVDSLRLPTFQNFDILLPHDIAEQTAIASILSDMDAEIVVLTAKLNKLRNIKQGMMSELLTGHIRLVEQEAR